MFTHTGVSLREVDTISKTTEVGFPRWIAFPRPATRDFKRPKTPRRQGETERRRDERVRERFGLTRERTRAHMILVLLTLCNFSIMLF